MKITRMFTEGGLLTFTEGGEAKDTSTFTEGRLPTFIEGRELPKKN